MASVTIIRESVPPPPIKSVVLSMSEAEALKLLELLGPLTGCQSVYNALSDELSKKGG